MDKDFGAQFCEMKKKIQIGENFVFFFFGGGGGGFYYQNLKIYIIIKKC
jgi:hypothetical protein